MWPWVTLLYQNFKIPHTDLDLFGKNYESYFITKSCSLLTLQKHTHAVFA